MQGSCDEEAQKIEAFVDRVRGRMQVLGAKQAMAEAWWQLQGIPWNASVYSAVRANSLHLATLYMSRSAPCSLPLYPRLAVCGKV